MKVYLIMDGESMDFQLLTENELREFVETELKKGDRIKEDDLWDTIDVDTDEIQELMSDPNWHWWDLSLITAEDLVRVIMINPSNDFRVKVYELPEYYYELEFGQKSEDYKMKRLAPETFEVLHSRQEADKYLETIRGLTDKE